MIKSKFQKKLLIYLLCIILIAFLIGVLLCACFAGNFFAMMKRNTMVDIYEKIEELYDEEDENFLEPGSDNYDELLSLCEKNSVSILILDSSGNSTYLYGNNYSLITRLNNIIFSGNDDAEIIEEDDSYTLQVASLEDGQYIEIWGFLSNGNGFIARTSYSGIADTVKISMFFFLIISLIIFLFVGIFNFLVVRKYAKTLVGILDFAQKTNEGDFEFEYEEIKHKKDELDLLGENIHAMAQKLQSTIRELRTSNINLQNELKDKMTEEEARKKYVSDVSHELKTPVAIIASYAEGLKEGVSSDPEDVAYYCDVIIDESEKMNVMIKKLATLNKLEQGSSEVIMERFNVIEVIDGLLNRMAPIISENEINLYFNNENVIYVWSDEFLFEEALINYINNAMNHVDENKIIKIYAEPYAQRVRITVYNSGKNIAEEEIDKIWGKFYKIDTARTREYGGSGLGLSIVKAIADSLEQKCGVYNMADGVAFWIDLEYASGRSAESGEDEEKEKTEKFNITEFPLWKRVRGDSKKSKGEEEDASDK